YAAANGAFDALELLQSAFVVWTVGVHHHVTHLVVGLQVLGSHVDVVIRKHFVDGGKNTGHVGVNVQQAVGIRVTWQRHFREVDRAGGGAVVGVFNQFFCHFHTDIGLGFHGGAADMRGKDHVIQASQRADELVIVGFGFFREDVDRGTGQVAAAHRFSQRIDIYDSTPGGVDQDGAFLHQADLTGTNHVLGGMGFR